MPTTNQNAPSPSSQTIPLSPTPSLTPTPQTDHRTIPAPENSPDIVRKVTEKITTTDSTPKIPAHPPQRSLREQWQATPVPGGSTYQGGGNRTTINGVSLKEIIQGFAEYAENTMGLPDGSPDGSPLGLLQDYAYDRKVFMLAQGVCQKWRISRPPLMLKKPLYLTRVTIHTIIQRDGTVIKRTLDPSTGDPTMDRYIYELFDTIGLYPRIPDHFDRDIYVHSFSFAVRLPAGASHPEFYFGKYQT